MISKPLRLLSEIMDPKLLKAETIMESDGTGAQSKSIYLAGPFMVSEQRNKNGRVYKKNVIEREVQSFTSDKIKNNRAGGELNHPESPTVNLDRISHYIKELRCEGDVFYGKAKLANTPMGLVAQTLVKDGYQLGVSSRGLGDVAEDGEVSEDFKLITVDIVADPSAPGAFMEALYENRKWLMNEKGEVFEAPVKGLEKRFKKIPKDNAQLYLIEAIQEFIKEIKSK